MAIMLIFFLLLPFTIAILVELMIGRRPRQDLTELKVEKELERVLKRRGYIVFSDLIIPSVSKSIKSTQIDHVVVSLYGIFCIETKAHRGNIYGGSGQKYWKQYLGNSIYELYSPMRQNKHHVESLEYLLRSRLKAPVHSYLVFPHAYNVKLDGQRRDFSIDSTIDRILGHSRLIYTPEDVEAIAKGLALVSSHADRFRGDHIDAVQEYLGYQRRQAFNVLFWVSACI